VTNSLRLLGLPPEIKALVSNGQLTEGHGRALLQAGSAAAMLGLAEKIVRRQLSVRATERQARKLASGRDGQTAREEMLSPNVRSLVEKLQRALGARVELRDRRGRGRLEVTYTSYEELDRILDKILR